MIFAKELGDTLRGALTDDPRVVLLGEDIADPYGGAFKVTRGLSTAFPQRVRTTPISEGAIAGVSAGLALAGYRPIAEVMFGDFLTLMFDQVVNHIAKYQAMYAGQATCPVVVRAATGGHRGYGPTHSQSLEKHFLGVPHLRVVAASLFHDPREVFSDFLGRDEPVLYVEHKLLYPQHLTLPVNGRIGDLLATSEGGPLPTVRLSAVPVEDCTVSVLAYGYQAMLAAKVIERLAMEEEIFAELLVPAQIAPMDWAPVERSVAVTGRLVTVEEGADGWSWGTEAASVISRRLFGRLRRPVDVVASEATVIPSSKTKEASILVGSAQIEAAIRAAAR
ncbi:alpha-ketoacid dehydrogenase subunit beta [Actinoplanes regularis]|uniref:Pyruvate dehydrogenase E1 component beta subunit n=1 Tax=Actinoplanes regularis TaxID=52697 RepID=A0A239E026_9ACTN|nr:transketolase C-terminal domain-containing protein [Actinoplanes regularis]GIE88918.1 pyruvate dehydrogenase [Actinoplanes regularis]SNS37869.1 pyruvate dehydrogenase E1 component beta subunit [Actinoplanes regularis]